MLSIIPNRKFGIIGYMFECTFTSIILFKQVIIMNL